MPDAYLRFKSSLQFAFVSSFDKHKTKVLGNLFSYGLHKPSRYFKLKNLLIGHTVNNVKSRGSSNHLSKYIFVRKHRFVRRRILKKQKVH